MEELFCTSSNIYKSPSVRFTFCLRAAVIYTLHVCVRVLRMTENAFEYPAGPVISNEADTGSRLNPTDLYLHTSRRLCVLTLCRESWVLTELASVHAGLGPLCCSASNSTKTQWTREPSHIFCKNYFLVQMISAIIYVNSSGCHGVTGRCAHVTSGVNKSDTALQ